MFHVLPCRHVVIFFPLREAMRSQKSRFLLPAALFLETFQQPLCCFQCQASLAAFRVLSTNLDEEITSSRNLVSFLFIYFIDKNMVNTEGVWYFYFTHRLVGCLVHVPFHLSWGHCILYPGNIVAEKMKGPTSFSVFMLFTFAFIFSLLFFFFLLRAFLGQVFSFHFSQSLGQHCVYCRF